MNSILSSFIVFEGLDGSGKSTQARLLCRNLEKKGLDAVLTAEPTDNPVGCLVRQVLRHQVDTTSQALALLRASTPAALAPVRADYVVGRLPALEAWLNRSTWELSCLDAPFSADDLLRGIAAVRERGTITYLRGEKEKRVDVSASLVDVSACDAAEGVEVRLETRHCGSGALRPQVLLSAALDAASLEAPRSLCVRRTAQRHEESGCLVEPFGPFATSDDAPLS